MKEKKFEDASEVKKWGVFAKADAGVLTPINFNDLNVLGSGLDPNRNFVEIRFVMCFEENDPTCASKSELEAFLETH